MQVYNNLPITFKFDNSEAVLFVYAERPTAAPLLFEMKGKKYTVALLHPGDVEHADDIIVDMMGPEQTVTFCLVMMLHSELEKLVLGSPYIEGIVVYRGQKTDEEPRHGRFSIPGDGPPSYLC